MWLTTDKTNILYVWDIQAEVYIHRIQSKKLDKRIIKVEELPVLRLVAIATVDKITIWDIFKEHYLFKIKHSNPKAGINQFIFSNTYSILLVAGFENNISIYNINPVYKD